MKVALSVLLTASYAAALWTDVPVDWDFLPTPRRASQSARAIIKKEISGAESALTGYLKAAQRTAKTQGAIGRECGSNRLTQFVLSKF
ncbi:MAG: hypothetical protein COR54_15005 [Elusimicrobia bacterium CG22_combo_CG10-13_8_21_14_all_63_91]|nr:MAG: hypothetical protein COR54_15005 [Elusimicrobia bacterium CG22_combo_CG10-13_8_21_14_all_63_91]